MATKKLPDPEILRQLLRYEPETGKLFWRERTPEMFSDGAHSAAHSCNKWNSKYAGREAFTATNAGGYKIGSVLDTLLRAHRVAWAIATGDDAAHQVDHINGDRADNRLLNLRAVTNRENSTSAAKPKNNTSGFCGVSFHRGRIVSKIKVHGRQIYLGSFPTLEAASAAYEDAKRRYGFSERHGIQAPTNARCNSPVSA